LCLLCFLCSFPLITITRRYNDSFVRMRMIRATYRLPAVCLTVLVFLQSLSGNALAQSREEVLDRVSKNVKEFQEQLPDFVCTEKVTSTEFEAGKRIKQKVVESTFTGVQRSTAENRVNFAFTESREVVAIDGKPVRNGTPFPKLPYRYAGGYSSLLVTTFAPDNLEIHNYSIGDTYKSGSSSSLLVRFATKEDQQKLRGIFQGTQLVAKDIGAAWIDQKTFRVLRLQRQSLNLPPTLSRSIATVDYGPVTIGGTEFWMPTRVRADVDERNSRLSVSYVAEYSDCRKFMADIKLVQ
jgi:hypothetical protein